VDERMSMSEKEAGEEEEEAGEQEEEAVLHPPHHDLGLGLFQCFPPHITLICFGLVSPMNLKS